MEVGTKAIAVKSEWLLSTLVALPAVGACAGEATTVPFDQISDEKRLADLSADENRGYCRWTAKLAIDELPPRGTQLLCDGVVITLAGPGCQTTFPPGCDATIADAEACMPGAFARIGDDPCVLTTFTSDEAVQAFIGLVPECERFAPCGTAR